MITDRRKLLSLPPAGQNKKDDDLYKRKWGMGSGHRLGSEMYFVSLNYTLMFLSPCHMHSPLLSIQNTDETESYISPYRHVLY